LKELKISCQATFEKTTIQAVIIHEGAGNQSWFAFFENSQLTFKKVDVLIIFDELNTLDS
jgi:hypothetical protein